MCPSSKSPAAHPFPILGGYPTLLRGPGTLELFFDGGVPHETLKWGS